MKTSLVIPVLGVLLIFAINCREVGSTGELEAFKARADVEWQNMELAKRYIEVINSGHFDALNELLSSDYAIYSPSGYPEASSREALINNYESSAEAFSAFKWNIEDIIASDDKVICRISVAGKTREGIPGLPTQATPFEFSLISIMRFENGKIAEEWQEDDQLGLARQLGMELRPKN